MDLVRYAERAATLLNARLDTLEDVQDFLTDRDRLLGRVAEKDGQALRRFQRELRPVFECAADGDERATVEELNAVIDKHPITPRVTGDGPGRWHLSVGETASSVSELLVTEAVLGLAFLACDRGPDRLGTCGARGCDSVYVDTSPNRTRRYCSDRCSSRTNVAAYRARRRARAATGGDA